MSWGQAFAEFAIYGCVAAAGIVALLSAPGRRVFTAVVGRLARLPPAGAVLLVVAVTVGLRLGLQPTFEPAYETDVKEYVEKAAAIAEDGHPRRQEVRPDGRHFYRTLGYSLPLAGWYAATGTDSVRSAQVFNVLTAAITAWLIVLLGSVVAGPGVGRLAGLGFALYLPLVQFSLLPYGETWATLLTVGAALFFERLRRSGTATAAVGWAAATGLALGFLVITRTEFLWLPPLAVCGLARLGAPGRRLVPALALCATALIPLAVNHQLRAGYPGHLRTSVQGGLILYFGNNPFEVTGEGNATPLVVGKARELYRRDPTGGEARSAALTWMAENPHLVALNAPKKVFHLWLTRPQGFGWRAQTGKPDGMNRRLAAVLVRVAYASALFVLLAGALGLLRRREFLPWTVVIALHLAMWALLASSARNRYMLEPFLVVAAAAWLVDRTRAEAEAPPNEEAPAA